MALAAVTAGLASMGYVAITGAIFAQLIAAAAFVCAVAILAGTLVYAMNYER